jgi:hypothetical protein
MSKEVRMFQGDFFPLPISPSPHLPLPSSLRAVQSDLSLPSDNAIGDVRLPNLVAATTQPQAVLPVLQYQTFGSSVAEVFLTGTITNRDDAITFISYYPSKRVFLAVFR